MAEPYVHNEVTLTCSNGFHTSTLLVKNRGVFIAGGKLIATYEDKPKNFACKWAGVLVAIVVAACIAAPFIVAVLAGFLIGILASLSIGDLLCWIALRGATWQEVHSKVRIKGIRPLLGDSKLICPVFGGDIKIFYDAETAGKQNNINIFNNSVEILGAAFMGRSFRMFANSIQISGWINASTSFGSGIIKSLLIGYGSSELNNTISNVMVDEDPLKGSSDLLTGGEDATTQSYAMSNYQKPFTDPLYTDGERDAIVKGDKMRGVPIDRQNGKMTDNAGRFDAYGKSQAEVFKANNPVHRYSRGKNSPHYRRQIGKQEKLNSKAKALGEKKSGELSGRYEKRVTKEVAKNLNRADYGILAAFIVSDLISRYAQKNLDKFGMNKEMQARQGIKIQADEH
ncbi:DUF4280 domain-containing protein [Pedobacter sp. PAMC26386]|nr:DUF4280 domain-containing protein [Pedobacter sp. PAMC26386]